MMFPEVIFEGKNRDFDFLDEASESEINNIYPKTVFSCSQWLKLDCLCTKRDQYSCIRCTIYLDI